MAETIHIKLPDGSDKEVPKGTTALQIATEISPRLADAAFAAKVRPLGSGNGLGSGNQHHADSSVRATQDLSDKNVRPTQSNDGDLIDLTRPLEKDVEL